jgi:membrane-bound serine protease (ClpP class)
MMAPQLILAFTLIGAGFLLLAVEMFFPSGICFALSLAGFVAGIVIAFLYDVQVGWMALGGTAVAFVGMLWLLRYCWTRTSLGRNMVLQAPQDDATLAGMPLNKERERLIGRIGRTEGPLRPAGIAIFDSERIDCLTEGMLVEGGQMVRCIAVHGGRVIVRPVATATAEEFEKPLFD